MSPGALDALLDGAHLYLSCLDPGSRAIIDDVETPETCAGRMLGAATAQIKADAPVLRPYGPIPLQPVQ